MVHSGDYVYKTEILQVTPKNFMTKKEKGKTKQQNFMTDN